MGRKYDLTGQRFGRLTVIEKGPSDKRKEYRWWCLCDCGNKKLIVSYRLRTTTRSCGCLIKEVNSKRKLKHGHCRRINGKAIKSKEYGVWAGMKSRCYNTKENSYINYGGRGITVCDEWINSFEQFLRDMGERPDWATGGIDRIDNNGNYTPKNCRWSTKKEQVNNRRNFEGKGGRKPRMTKAEVEEVLYYLKKGERYETISTLYNISLAQIHKIKYGKLKWLNRL